MKKHLTLSQRIHNAEGAQAAEYLHARHAYLHAMNHQNREFGEMWSRSDDVSWAHGFGRWRGWESLWFAHVSGYVWKGLKVYGDIFENMPEVSWLTDHRALVEIAIHSLANDIIEVADDGQSARACFLTPGLISSACTPQMTYRGQILWERYGADFVFEDGEWKYLHEHVCPDFGGSLDVANVGADEYQKLVNPALAGQGPTMGEGDPSMKLLADPGPLHRGYTPVQTVQNTVPWPEPYVTMDNDNTYTKKQ